METLSVNTLFTGKVLIHLSTTDSTNNYASTLLSKNHAPLEGTVILADYQSAGKGYSGNTWDARAGQNILMSLIIYPQFLSAAMQFNLNMAVSLGIYDALKPLLGEGLTIKWPNDIYFNTQKIGGILIENSIRATALQSSIIGIGLNVNQTTFAGGINALSLSLITGQHYDVFKITALLCEHIEPYYLSLKKTRGADLKDTYESHLFGIGQSRTFKKNNDIFIATIKGITPEGKLILESPLNPLKGTLEFGFKEVEFVF